MMYQCRFIKANGSRCLRREHRVQYMQDGMCWWHWAHSPFSVARRHQFRLREART